MEKDCIITFSGIVRILYYLIKDLFYIRNLVEEAKIKCD